jgi:hypothetical protein
MWPPSRHLQLVAAIRASANKGIQTNAQVVDMFVAYSTQSVGVAAQTENGKRPYAFLAEHKPLD